MKKNEKETNKISRSALAQLAVSVVFLICMLTVLSPCGPKEDGTYMSCHYAGLALTALAAGMAVVSILRLILKNRLIRGILSLVEIALAVAVILIPDTVIALCMMPDMRCRLVMRPGSIVFAVLMILASVILPLAGRKAKR